ncbi:MAG: DnaK suppressor protein [Rhodothermales bacterium]|jgi:DnaK suppressor protein
MSPAEKAQLRARMEGERDAVSAELSDLEAAAAPIAPDRGIGRISRMDAIQNRGINERALRRARNKGSNLELALSKIDDDDFGLCMACRGPIGVERIMAIPDSSLCVYCSG